jgi:hypothetical protein
MLTGHPFISTLKQIYTFIAPLKQDAGHQMHNSIMFKIR